MKKNSSHYSADFYQREFPCMANPFARRIMDRRLQPLEEPGSDKHEVCFTREGIANILSSVDAS
jgi:hypothetical protein